MGGSPMAGHRFTCTRTSHAEQLMVVRKEEAAALVRFRRCFLWASSLFEAAPTDEAIEEELVAARAGIAWILLRRSAPILDLGTVRSDVLAVAKAELEESQVH